MACRSVSRCAPSAPRPRASRRRRLQCAVIDAAEATTRHAASTGRSGGEGLISVANEQHEMRSWFLEAHSFRMAHERAQFDQQRVAAATEAAAVGRAWATALDEWRKSSRGTLLHHHRAAAKAFRQLARDTRAHLAEIAEQHPASVMGAWEQLGAEHAAAAAAEELRLAKLAQLRELANVEWAEHAERGFGGHAGVLSALAGGRRHRADSKALEPTRPTCRVAQRASGCGARRESAERRADHETSKATICQATRRRARGLPCCLVTGRVVTAACDDGGNTQTTERAPPPELGTLLRPGGGNIDTSVRGTPTSCATPPPQPSARLPKHVRKSAGARVALAAGPQQPRPPTCAPAGSRTPRVGRKPLRRRSRRRRARVHRADEAFGDVRELAERLGASVEVHVPNEESMDQRSPTYTLTYQLALERERRASPPPHERVCACARRAARGCAADRAQARARRGRRRRRRARRERRTSARRALAR